MVMGRKSKKRVTPSTRVGRPHIPSAVKRDLWIAAAGRCEFPTCNKPLWYDRTGLSEGNYSEMAHIVAATPNGPRGDAVNSPQLVTDISNLLLLCPEHNTMIDLHKEEYSVDRLLQIKRERELAIKKLLDDLCSGRTTVIRYSSTVGGSVSDLSNASIRATLFPRVPHEEDFIELQYNERVHDGDVEGLQTVSDDLQMNVSEKMSRKSREGELHLPLSVFARGRIPLLISLGRALCATDGYTVYQPHRDTGSWRWAEETGGDLTPNEDVRVVRPSNPGTSAIPAVAVSISGNVSQDEIEDIIGKDICLYTIVAGVPGADFMHYESQLRRFRDIWSQLMGEIREISPKVQNLPIFSAVPVSVAVQMGIQHIQADPCWLIYELRTTKNGWEKAIELR